MITRPLLTIAAAALLTIPLLQAQAPQPGAAPAATPPPATTPPATTPAAAGKPKPLSAADAKALSDLFEAMQFHIRMGEVARHKDKDDKELLGFANKIHKEMTEQWTPLVSAAMNRNMKNIPSAVSKGDKDDIAKLGKEKGDKWKAEYFELFAKNGKRNVRTAENAVKALQDPELKAPATKVAAVITSQADAADAKAKELKPVKK